jgi:phospholipid/cholesterol/gamma-HCH transport system ATP-binding protein
VAAGAPRKENTSMGATNLSLSLPTAPGLSLSTASGAVIVANPGQFSQAALEAIEQKVFALALDPEILFLDEPTAGLDPIGAAAFDQLLLTLRDAFNLTVFMVTHDLDTLYASCDRVAVISQKKVLIVDTLENVAANPDPWIQSYFHGPRGRAAATAATGNAA